MAEPIDLPFGLWTLVQRRKDKFNRIRQVAPLCLHGKAHWRYQANTTEPSVCGRDAVLCQMTLTTCCFILRCLFKINENDYFSEQRHGRAGIYNISFRHVLVDLERTKPLISPAL